MIPDPEPGVLPAITVLHSRTENNDMKHYGIRITLPQGDTLRAAHLLGENWESFRWYDTAEERDAAFEDVQMQVAYYRKGDKVSQVVEKVER